MSSAAVELIGLSFSYGDLVVFRNLTLSVNSGGEVVSLLGPSGVGKSTLLHLVLGTIKPQEGTVRVRGTALPVIQNFKAMVLPWFNLRKNITWGLREGYSDVVADVVKLLEIDSKLETYPAQLSGGQVQRLVLARALVRRPEVLLLDEPLSSVDIGAQRRIMPNLRAFVLRERISTIWITHSLEQALLVSDRIVVLQFGGVLREIDVKGRDREDVLRSVTLELLGEKVMS